MAFIGCPIINAHLFFWMRIFVLDEFLKAVKKLGLPNRPAGCPCAAGLKDCFFNFYASISINSYSLVPIPSFCA
jgi:hypothetical protein